MFDYVALSGEHDGRWIEYVDHLHEHFVDPVAVAGGRYRAPRAPGSSSELRVEAMETYQYISDAYAVADGRET
jgi:L-fuconate dehydratase